MKLHFAHTSQVKCNLNPANGWCIAKDHKTGAVCMYLYNKSNTSNILTDIARKGVQSTNRMVLCSTKESLIHQPNGPVTEKYDVRPLASGLHTNHVR